MVTSPTRAARRDGPGRPREFDIEAAVDSALLVFRERGYQAASLDELGAAMQLTAGSIYKAFGDKRTLFLAAFDRYTSVREQRLQALLDAQATGRDQLRAMVDFYADSASGVEGRRGCMVVGAATQLSTFDAEMAGRVTASLKRNEARLLALVRAGQSDGSLAPTLDAAATARALLALLQGFRVVGKTGRTRADMRAAAAQAMRLVDVA